MEQRMNVYEIGHKGIAPLYGLGLYLSKSSIEKPLLDLLSFRVSQINRCAFCLDMHSKDLRSEGETEQRIYTLNAWRETSFYTERERAALSFAEAVNNCNVPDEIYKQAREHFSEEELIDLTLSVIGTGCFNRINIAFRTTAGNYEPGQFAVK